MIRFAHVIPLTKGNKQTNAPYKLKFQSMISQRKSKVLSVLLTLLVLCSYSLNAQKLNISLNEKNTKLETVLRKISNQVHYDLIFQTQKIKKDNLITVNLNNVTLEQALDKALENLPLEYVISDQTIIIREKTSSSNITTSIKDANQSALLSGNVKSNNGQALDNTTIILKQGTKVLSTKMSDQQGDFSFKNLPDGNITISFTRVGYHAKQIEYQSGKDIPSFLSVTMIPTDAVLDEVVVIGYGTQKKKDLTGSLTTIGANDYKDQPVTDVSQALQGRAAGVQISAVSGAPGSEVKVRIRGGNSVNFSNSPLFVVDGIAYNSVDFNKLNVNDIASMEILKDASATAIYGSRGANGVVMISTKSGKYNTPPGVEINSFVSFNKPQKYYKLLDPYDYVTLANVVSPNHYTDLDQYKTMSGTNWQKQIFDNSIQQSNSVAVSGGSENFKYFLSGYYIYQNGLITNTDQRKFGIRSNFNVKLSKKVNLSSTIFLSRFNNHNIAGNTGIIPALTWPSLMSVYNSEGTYNAKTYSPIYPNPYMTLKEQDIDNFTNLGVVTTKLQYDIFDWLSLTYNAGLDYQTTKTGQLSNSWIVNNTPDGLGRSSQAYAESYTWQNNAIIGLQKKLNKHSLSGSLVFEATKNKTTGFNASGSNLSSFNYGYDNLGLNGSSSIMSTYTNWSLLSYIGRINYNYDNRYFLTATMRRDGSSKFNEQNRWGNFPSVGLAWNLFNEDFIKSIGVFSNLKLRGSWGIAGNQNIPPYSTLGLLSANTYSYGTAISSGAYLISSPPTPNLKWEKTYQTDLGLEAGFFNNRLNVTVDLYNKNTKDLILSTLIPYYNGGGTQLKNVGSVNNKGLELGLEGLVVESKDFKWTANFNVAFNINKITSLGDDTIQLNGTGTGTIIKSQYIAEKVGNPISSFYLIPWEGVYQAAEGKHLAGDPKYKDLDGDGVIGDGDRAIAGSALPKIQLGFNNTFTYKNWDLNLFWQGSFGNKIFNASYLAAAIPSSDISFINLKDAASYWTPTNTSSTWANPGNTGTESAILPNTTQFLQNGSYLRFKNISLSYTFNKAVLKKAIVKIYASAQNLITITSYKGFDPEASSTSASTDGAAGIDLGAYPSPKTLTVGCKLNF